MDEKIKATIDKIEILTNQNHEFDIELRKRLNIASANIVLQEDDRISHIYEYCIEEVIKKQANEFYNDFPISSIKDILIEDFIRMEFFRRKDNFGDFCLSLYQQIECITNKLCEDRQLTDITEKMWGEPAYIKVEKNATPSLSERSGDYNIASLIFPGQNKNGTLNSLEKSKVTLQSQYANDKIRIIVYFLGYKAMLKSSDFDSFKEITSLLNDIYQCRNMNHRGNTLTPWEKETIDRIIPLKSLYYFKFLGVLAQYIEYVKTGIPFISMIKEYSDTIIVKKEVRPQPKVLGKIDLKDDGRKRFK